MLFSFVGIGYFVIPAFYFRLNKESADEAVPHFVILYRDVRNRVSEWMRVFYDDSLRHSLKEHSPNILDLGDVESIYIIFLLIISFQASN
jgi:hypothetical protein